MDLPTPATLTANGSYDIPGCTRGAEYLIALKGTFGGATVALHMPLGANNVFEQVEGGSWTAAVEDTAISAGTTNRLVVSGATGTTAIAVTFQELK